MASLFALRTHHNTRLSVDQVENCLLHVDEHENDPAMLSVFILCHDAVNDRSLLFTCNPVTGRPVFPRERGSGDVLVMVAKPEEQDVIAIQNATTGRFASAIPVASRIDVDRKVVSNWERFHQVPVKPRDFAGHKSSYPLFWTNAITMLLAGTVSHAAAELLEAIWPQLTLEEFDDLACELRRDPEFHQNIARFFPKDFWATSALPRFFESQSGLPPVSDGFVVEPPQPLFIGPTLDHLAKDGLDGSLVSFAHAINASLRRTVKPSEGVAIVASARSEGIYILEWIAHHRILGVERFFLYTNNNDDGSDELLAALHANRVITWTKNELGPTTKGISAQVKGYGHALNVMLPLLDYRWALFNDLDEFLVLNNERFCNINDFARFHEMRQTDAVGINWVMVGSTGQSNWRDEPLTRRNTHLLGETNPHIKVMMYPSRFIQAHPHFPFCDFRRTYTFRLAGGELHEHRKQPPNFYHAKAFADNPSEEAACLYHYAYKSVDEFVWKSSRNRGNSPVSQGTTFDGLTQGAVTLFLDQHQSVKIRENDRISRCAPGLDEEIERLRKLPNVRHAERAAIDNFRARLAEIKAEFILSPRLKELGILGEQIRTLVVESGI